MRQWQEWTSTAGYAALLVVLLVAPFPYGSTRPLAEMRLEILSFLTLVLAVVGARDIDPIRKARVPVLAVAVLIGLALLQLVPMGAAALRALSPASAGVWHDAATVLGLYGRPAPAARITIVPWETVQLLLLVAAYAALFLSTVLLARSRERRLAILAVLVAGGVAHTVIAAMTTSSPLPGMPYSDRAHGVFVNPNNLASYLAICLAAAFGLVLARVLRWSRNEAAGDGARGLAARLGGVLAPLVTGVAIAAGILLTQSRAGIVAAAASLFLVGVLATLHPRVRTRRKKVIAGLLLALAVATVLVTVISSRELLYRFLVLDPRDPESQSRLSYWETSIDAWERYPVLGSGLGTFREAFRHVEPRDDERIYITHAHSDPLEILVTGGVVGLGAALFGWIGTIWLLFRGWWRQKHREESAWILAGIGALLAVSLHSLVDFPFTIPAIPATLAILVGVSWSARPAERAFRPEPSAAPPRRAFASSPS